MGILNISRVWVLNGLIWLIKKTGIFYNTPINLNYWWNFGVLSFFFLIIQIVTGLVLSMFYDPSVLNAFASVSYINNELYYGWWVRLVHANGASFFFLCVYIHFFRGFFYGSFLYPRQMLWISGVVMYILMVVIAFLGYVLPWGQMSYWAAMVITSLLAAIPLIGSDLVFLVWGGFTIDNASLHRFYALHFGLPFILVLLSVIHVMLLHERGSSNPVGVQNPYDNVGFTPIYLLKDFLGILLMLWFFFFFLFVVPDYFGHTLNYQEANFLVTPPHIVPEWYLLFYYAILRSIPGKLMGLLIMASSLLIILLLPFILSMHIIRSGSFKPVFKICFWLFLFDTFLLGWVGGSPVIEPFLGIGLRLTVFYFVIVLVFMPLSGYFDRFIYDTYVHIDRCLRSKFNVYF